MRNSAEPSHAKIMKRAPASVRAAPFQGRTAGTAGSGTCLTCPKTGLMVVLRSRYGPRRPSFSGLRSIFPGELHFAVF